MSLSDAFGGGENDIEVKVRMLNINYGKNRELMEACKPLNEYAWLVDRIRAYNETDQDIEIAVDKALDEMPDDFVIKEFLLAHRAEVKGMFLTEHNEEKTLQQERQEGIQEGVQRGINGANERVAMDILRENLPLSSIAKISTLSESTIRNMANALGGVQIKSHLTNMILQALVMRPAIICLISTRNIFLLYILCLHLM